MEGQRSDTALRPVRMRLPLICLLLSLPFASPFFARLGTAPRHPCVRCVAPVPDAPAENSSPPSGPPRTKTKLPIGAKRSKKNWRVISLHKKAQAAIKVGAFDEADELLREGLRLDQHDAHTWLSLARLTARVGDADEARELFERGTDTCPNNVRLVHARAVFETKSGRPAEARSLFTQAADMEPGNAYVSHAWGLLEESVGNATAAQGIYADLMSVKPQAQVCAAWAQLEARMGNIPRARSIYEQGWGLYDLGDWNAGEEEDEEIGNDARESSPSAAESVDLLVDWAQLECAAGNMTASRSLLRRGLQISPNRARVHLAIAQLQIQLGEHDAARKTFTECSKLPNAGSRDDQSATEYSELFNAWAAFESRAGDNEAALEVLERGRSLYPKDASLLQTLGITQKKHGDLENARVAFQRSIKLEPRGATYVAYAMLEAELGHKDLARQLFEQGAAADPTHGPLHSARAKFEERYGKNAERAREVLREAADQYPCATIFSAWGKLEERQGNMMLAAELYEKGAESVQGARAGGGRDDTSYLWHSLGSVLLQQRQLPRALDAFKEGLRRNPSSSQLLLGAAIVHSQQGQFEQARGTFLKSVQADASHAHAWQAWGVMEARMGNADVARDLYARGLRRCPKHAALWSASAKLEGEAGEHDRARQLFKKGVERNPKSGSLLVAWAYFEMHQGKTRSASDLLAHAKTVDSSSGEMYHVQALLHLKLGRPRDARQTVDEGLHVAPTHAPLYRVLGAMQDVAGEVEAARASFKEGLRLNPGYAQLYHAYARLEGRLANWGALNELNVKAKAAFPVPETPQMENLQDESAWRTLGQEGW